MHIAPELHWHNLDGSIDWLGGTGGGGGTATSAPPPDTANDEFTGEQQVDATGQVWGLTEDGEWKPIPGLTARVPGGGGGSSSSFNVSELGPEAVRLREAEQAQEQALAAQQSQLAWAKLQQDILASNQKLSFEQQNLQFLQDKMAIEQQAQNATAARETASLIEQITLRMERTSTERAGLMQRAQILQAQMQYQAQVENARNQIEADKTNEERRQFNLSQRRGVATDIANFAKDPGDVGANAAFLMAGGAAPISQAMAGGKDARTQQSLLPLGLLLGTQDELNRGPAFLNAPQVNAPNVPMPSFGSFTPPTAASLGLSPMPGGLPLAPRSVVPQPPVQAAPAPTAPPGSGQAAPPPGGTWFDPSGDEIPVSPYGQTQEQAVAAHQESLAQTGYDPASWEAIAAEYEARGYDIPGFARGGPSDRPPPWV